MVSYSVNDETHDFQFGQRVSFSHDGAAYLNYSSSTWLLSVDADADADADANAELGESPATTPLSSEIGYWRLSRPFSAADPGPAMLPGIGQPLYSTAEQVETLRNDDGGFGIEVSILQPHGVSELYLGQVKGPRIDLATDAVMRSATAKEHSASTRLYGLVDNHLLWAWDIAALGQPLTSHASGRLAHVD